jgi:hypothetical protein
MPETRGASELKLASAVAKRVQIRDVRLVAISAQVHSRAPVGKVFLNQDQEIRAEQSDGVVTVTIGFNLRGKQEEDASDPLVTLAATFELTYALEGPGEVEEEQLRAFANVNGLFNAWPYWRECVQNVSARMDLPKLTVPVFRVREPGARSGPPKIKETTPPTPAEVGPS